MSDPSSRQEGLKAPEMATLSIPVMTQIYYPDFPAASFQFQMAGRSYVPFPLRESHLQELPLFDSFSVWVVFLVENCVVICLFVFLADL
jgi:hypothetical protein